MVAKLSFLSCSASYWSHLSPGPLALIQREVYLYARFFCNTTSVDSKTNWDFRTKT